MKKFVATDAALSAHAALVRAQEAFNIRLETFTAEAVTAIDDIANMIGKPIWHKTAVGNPFVGDITGYLFDFDESDAMFTIEGYICENDAGEVSEVDLDDCLFEEPKKPRRKAAAKKEQDDADG